MKAALEVADLAKCRRGGHRFKTVWSDKTPLKAHLVCLTCSEASGKSTFVAFANKQIPSFGQWRRPTSSTEHKSEEVFD